MKALASLAAVLTLSGCGLQPLYAGGGNGEAARALASVSVPAIEGQSGWLVRNALIDRLGTAGEGGARYRLDVRLDDKLEGLGLLHVFNVHLGTAFLERRHQARKLMDRAILKNRELGGSRIMLGDFNEWTRGLTTKLLSAHLKSADIRSLLQRSKTYPGVMPILHLDHIYFEDSLEMESLNLHRSRRALMASDHLPLYATLTVRSKAQKAS